MSLNAQLLQQMLLTVLKFLPLSWQESLSRSWGSIICPFFCPTSNESKPPLKSEHSQSGYLWRHFHRHTRKCDGLVSQVSLNPIKLLSKIAHLIPCHISKIDHHTM